MRSRRTRTNNQLVINKQFKAAICVSEHQDPMVVVRLGQNCVHRTLSNTNYLLLILSIDRNTDIDCESLVFATRNIGISYLHKKNSSILHIPHSWPTTGFFWRSFSCFFHANACTRKLTKTKVQRQVTTTYPNHTQMSPSGNIGGGVKV